MSVPKKRVLVVGHWDLSSPDLSGGLRSAKDVIIEGSGFGNGTDATQDALAALTSGIRSTYDHMVTGSGSSASEGSDGLTVEVVPFGPGRAAELAAQGASPRVPFVSDSRDASSSRDLGENIRAAALAHPKSTVVVVGGHSRHHDWGAGLLSGLTGAEGETLDEDSSEEQWLAALDAAQDFLDSTGVSLVFAAQTARPLIGAGSPAQLAPTLEPRISEAATRGIRALEPLTLTRASSQGSSTQQCVQAALVRHFRSRDGVVDPTRIPGSGASGGGAAVLAALGAQVRPAFDVLEGLLDLESRVAQADLVVVLEPHLDVPELSGGGGGGQIFPVLS